MAQDGMMFLRTQRNGPRTYLLMVENQWVNGRVKQRVLQRLGRLDVLQRSGQLDALMVSLARFSEKLAVLGVHAQGAAQATRTTKVGPALVFERLWREVGIGEVLRDLLAGRQFTFPVERAVFLTVLHRLFSSGSDRAAEKWKENYRIRGVDRLGLHHLYRAMAWLGEVLPGAEQGGATPFAPRCVKDCIEEQLFARRRDLFTGIDLVFFDTTSIFFEGAGGAHLGQYGHSKDHRPDRKQMVVGVVLDGDGNPICSEMWPGNTTDVKALVPVAQRLQRRFGVQRVCVVADRGMVSAQTMRQIEAQQWTYILGARMRRHTEVRDEVLAQGGRYQKVVDKGPGAKARAPLQVKEVRVNGRRYVICRNTVQAAKDRHDREAIVAALRSALRQGDKSLVGNTGYRRYLKTRGRHFTIDAGKVKTEARYDGKWVLVTNTHLAAAEIALKYKQLWMVESLFRSMKTLLQTRPVYHRGDAAIRGHVFCSFLALVLRKELEDRLVRGGRALEWADVIRDLDNLVEIDITAGGKTYILRSEAKQTAATIFRSCGVALPPTLRQR